MYHFKKNFNGTWKTVSLSKEEVAKIQAFHTTVCLNVLESISGTVHSKFADLATNAHDKLVELLFNKQAPTYYDLANDYIEKKLAKSEEKPKTDEPPF